mmetsp:Transcript_52516/g.105248  ORF Transcript_52516/g.105248 Transcript_52516/m.105248 type:complete len:107 (-) Transcript_52516:130-450(-)
MANDLDRSYNQKHFPQQEGDRGSQGQICCCVGGFQKQKLIDSMLQANKSLARQVADLENERKVLKQTVLQREKTIAKGIQANELLQHQNRNLEGQLEKQKTQLVDW